VDVELVVEDRPREILQIPHGLLPLLVQLPHQVIPIPSPTHEHGLAIQLRPGQRWREGMTMEHGLSQGQGPVFRFNADGHVLRHGVGAHGLGRLEQGFGQAYNRGEHVSPGLTQELAKLGDGHANGQAG